MTSDDKKDCFIALNKRRREEFLIKKSRSLENADSDKDASQIATFSCDECEHVSKTDKGLKIHKGKTHKSVENLRRSSTDHPLEVSPIKEVGRLQPCNNCGENMSRSHVCHSDHEAEEVMQEQAKSPVSISPEQRALFGQMFSLYSNFYSSSDTKVTNLLGICCTTVVYEMRSCIQTTLRGSP